MYDTTPENKQFIDFFEVEKNGFFEVKPFVDCKYGFGAKKNLKSSKKNYVSQVGIYAIGDKKESLVPLEISLTYGKQVSEGVVIRSPSEFKLSDPLDVSFPNEFFFDEKTKLFYRKSKNFDPKEILNYVYDKHIKTTKLAAGFFTRAKIIILWYFLSKTCLHSSNFFSKILYTVSGNRYEYEPILQETRINNVIIDSVFRKKASEEKKFEEHLTKGKRFKFFDYEASYWAIVFYCFLHITLYFISWYFKINLEWVKVIFQNNFLTLIYVILSLFAIEFLLPKTLMWLTKRLAQMSLYFASVKIKI